MNDTQNGRDYSADVQRLDILEVALRNASAPWTSGFEVVSRLATQARYRAVAAPVVYSMRGCAIDDLTAALGALRRALEARS
jgi:hypothetical protein